ncbi:hypothetical protein BJ912DRAFT_800465, partial [Pholiota molesta]
LGTIKEHTVFEGECIRQLLGLQLLSEQAKTIPRHMRTTASIAVDNQASLQAHDRRKPQPGSYLIDEIQNEHRRIREKHPHITIKFRWVPGHEKIPGSERVDAQAKKATEGSEANKR